MKFCLIFIAQISFICSQIVYISPTICLKHCDGALDKPYQDISTALDKSKSAKTFFLYDGIYEGKGNNKLTIDDRLLEIKSLNGPNTTIIDCNGNSSGILFSGGNYSVIGISFKNCTKSGSGKASPSNSGGAISIYEGILSLTNVFIYNCSATFGGAISGYYSTFYVQSSIIVYNSATEAGAIYAMSTAFFIRSDMLIQFNKAYNTGGGIVSRESSFEIIGKNIIISNNYLTPSNILSQSSCFSASILINFTGTLGTGFECSNCSVLEICPNSTACIPRCLCDGQFYSEEACLNCDPSCGNCIGPTKYNCTSCNILHQVFNAILGTCACLQGFFLDSNEICQTCYTSCQTCSGALNNQCLSCKNGYHYRQGYCVDQCLTNEYVSLENICLPCDSSCLTCANGSINGCLNCSSNRILINGECPLCHKTCQTCSGTLNNECLTCITDYHYRQGYCFDHCLASEYLSTKNICLPCNNTCLTCFNESNDSCLSCPSDLILNNNQCISCFQTCETCSGYLDNQCLICKTGYYFRKGYCVEQCLRNEYISQENSCLPCDTTCLTCFNDTNENCLSCTSNHIFINNQCLPCFDLCETCSGILENQCLTCFNGYYYRQGYCVDKCLSNEFISSNNSCLTCDSSCLTCFNETAESCLNCVSNRILNKNKCLPCYNTCQTCSGTLKNQCHTCLNGFYYREGYCVDKCLSNEYISIKNYCFQCDESCLTCFNGTNDSCLSCKPNFLLNNSQCIYSNNNLNETLSNQTFIQQINFFQNIDFILGYTNDLNQISIKFLGNYEFLSVFNSEFFKLSIESFELGQDFFTVITQISKSEFLIHLYYLRPLIGGKILNLTVPYINKTKSIKLFDYYEIELPDLEVINSMSNKVEIVGLTTKVLFYVSLLNGGGPPGVIRSMMLMETIFMLKFINLNYPPNLMNFFIEKSKNSMIFIYKYKFTIDELDIVEIPSLFQLFEVSPYYLDNTGDKLAQDLFFFCLGLIFILISKLPTFTKAKRMGCLKKTFVKTILLIKNTLVWEYVLFIILTNIQEIFFYVVCAIKFLTLNNFNGNFNMFMAVLFMILHLCFLIYLFKIRQKISSQTKILVSINLGKNEASHIDNKQETSIIKSSGNMNINSQKKRSKSVFNNDLKDSQKGFNELFSSKDICKIEASIPIKKMEETIDNINLNFQNPIVIEKPQSKDLIPLDIFKKRLSVFQPKDYFNFPNKKIKKGTNNNSIDYKLKNEIEPLSLATEKFINQYIGITNSNQNQNLDENSKNSSKNTQEQKTSIKNDGNLKNDEQANYPVFTSTRGLIEREERLSILKNRMESPVIDSVLEENKFPDLNEKQKNSVWGSQISNSIIGINLLNSHNNLNSLSKKSWINNKKSIFYYPNISKNKQLEEKIVILKERYKALYDEFKTEKFLQRNFFFLDIIRQTLITLAVAGLFPNGFYQIIFINVVQLVFVITIFFIAPFEKKFSKINFAIMEIIMTLAFLSCLMISIYDEMDIEEIEIRLKIGWIIPYCNLGLLYWIFFTIFFKTISGIVEFLRNH